MLSSRTPEGDRNTCPICGHVFYFESLQIEREIICPSCGCLFWSWKPPAGGLVLLRLNIEGRQDSLPPTNFYQTTTTFSSQPSFSTNFFAGQEVEITNGLYSGVRGRIAEILINNSVVVLECDIFGKVHYIACHIAHISALS